MSTLSVAGEGKLFTGEEAEQIGIIIEVDTDAQIAYVEPDPDIVEAVLQGPGFGDADGDDIETLAESIKTVTDSELRVVKDL